MTNLEDALVAVEAGADAVGFVFYEKSPRYVSVEAAREIVEKLPESVDTIGVFVNETPARVSAIADEAGLTAVQFHGDEYQSPAQYVVNRDAFFCLPFAEAVQRLRAEGGMYLLPQLPAAAAILLDSGSAGQRGGTGKHFAWGEARPFVAAIQEKHHVVIAGGLSPANVVSAIGLLRPWGVDVVSGVEASPGRKDPEKVRAFVRAVREMDRRVS